MKTIKYLFLAIAIIAFGCKSKPYKTTKSGLRYKFYTTTGGEKAKIGDIITYNVLITNEKDSVYFSSFKANQPQVDRIQKSAFAGDLMEGFMMMAKGDSALFYISADSLTKGRPNPKIKPHSYIKFTIKMIEIKSEADYKKDMEKKQQEKMKQGEINKAKEQGLIDDYIKTKAPTAKKTDSGLYYIIEKEGTGPLAKPGDRITAHYAGTFLDGKEFDNDHGKPFSFKLGSHEVIPGWDEGFALLKKGSKAKFIIPSKLAYGAQGGGEVIPPYTPLVFEVELVGIGE